LNRIVNRTLEVDRRNPGGILSVDAGYDQFLKVKEAYLEAQASREESLKNTLRREIEWLKRGAKARTTKQKARIDRAENLKIEVQDLGIKNREQNVRLEWDAAGRGSKKLVELKGVSKGYGDRTILSGIDLLITPKSRIGLIGNNGVGKSTLIKLIAGVEEADSGDLKRAESLQVLYFEQNRDKFDPNVSLMKTVCPFGDGVVYRGRGIHIRTYLDKFLFTQDQMDLPVGKLSGGEQSRVLLAKLMLIECNLLVLDEPVQAVDFTGEALTAAATPSVASAATQTVLDDSADACARSRRPAVTRVGPVKALEAVSISVPVPVFVTPAAPSRTAFRVSSCVSVPAATSMKTVRGAEAAMHWMSMKSPAAPEGTGSNRRISIATGRVAAMTAS
jgi:ABC-type Mn2+/Zn2+ transport system ATPase subunit